MNATKLWYEEGKAMMVCIEGREKGESADVGDLDEFSWSGTFVSLEVIGGHAVARRSASTWVSIAQVEEVVS